MVQSGDNFSGAKSYIFDGYTIIENGYVTASLSGHNLRVKNDHSLGWVPIGKWMTITEAERNRVISIDNQSVKEIYQQYFGNKRDSVFFNPMILFPFIVERNDVFQTIIPIREIFDGSYEFLQPLYPGERVRFSYSDTITLADNLQKLKIRMQKYQPETVFVYSCSSRRLILEDDIHFDEEVLKFAPSSSGFFSYGEYFTDSHSDVSSFGQMLTVLLLSETSLLSSRNESTVEELFHLDYSSPKLLTQKLLRNLIASTTRELEEKNEELAELVSKRQFHRPYP